MTAPGAYAIDLKAAAGRNPTVVARGELDIGTSDELRACFDEALATGATVVEVDLSEVSFIDSSTLSVLAGVYRELQARDGRLVLAAASPIVTRVLDITGMSILLMGESPPDGNAASSG
jgi:anti-anti-sigma factor